MIIYFIINQINWKIYVGQSVRSFTDRISEHKSALLREGHKNTHLQNSVKKHHIDNFIFIEVMSGLGSQEELNYWETYFIELFKSYDGTHGYNKTYGGSNGKHTEESAQKISKSQKDHYSLDHPEAAERRARLKLNNDIYFSDSNVRKLHGLHTATKLWPSIKSPDGTEYPPMYNITDFCRDHGLTESIMRRMFKGQRKSHKGWTLVTQVPHMKEKRYCKK